MTDSIPAATVRYGMFLPLALMIASLVSSCFSYSLAKQDLTDDLNEAMISLVNHNSCLWTRCDTIEALRHMHETTHKPLIYQASDVNFRNKSLCDVAFYTLALVDVNSGVPKFEGNKIVSDSIMLVPEKSADGQTVYVQGFADCSMASVFAASDQTLPGVLFTLSIFSMAGMITLRRKNSTAAAIGITTISDRLHAVRLTPMQRQLTRMLLDAPGMKVDKSTLCAVLWNNKCNAEESLYTLVKRTKTALGDSGIEILCNRGESYELHIND